MTLLWCSSKFAQSYKLSLCNKKVFNPSLWNIEIKTRTLILKVVNKTVTNTLHGTNFQASNDSNRLV